jgi:hypothetical protein
MRSRTRRLASRLVQWLTLATWVIVAAIALPLSRGAAYGRASLGFQAPAALGGLAISMAICWGGPLQLAWWAFGCGVVGVFAVSVATASLTAERDRVVSERVERVEENEASLAGVQLPLLVTATIFSLLVALDIGLAG